MADQKQPPAYDRLQPSAPRYTPAELTELARAAAQASREERAAGRADTAGRCANQARYYRDRRALPSRQARAASRGRAA